MPNEQLNIQVKREVLLQDINFEMPGVWMAFKAMNLDAITKKWRQLEQRRILRTALEDLQNSELGGMNAPKVTEIVACEAKYKRTKRKCFGKL